MNLLVPFEYLTSNPTIAVGVSIISTLIIWLYKHSEANIQKNHFRKLNNIEDSLTELYQLESLISFCLYQFKTTQTLESEINLEIYRRLGGCNSYFGDDFRLLVTDYYNDNEYNKLELIKSILQGKIEELRKTKTVLLFDNDTEYVINYIASLLVPFKSIIGMLVLITYILLVLFITTMDTMMTQKVFLFAILNSFSISILFIYGFIIIPKLQ